MNEVLLAGKVSRVGTLKYTPSGLAVLRLTLAVVQELLGTKSIGYFDVQLFGELAETNRGYLSIGKGVKVTGKLWYRTYCNSRGMKICDIRVIAKDIENC